LGKNPDGGNENRPNVVFTRASTGLVKSISALDVLSFTFLAAGPVVLIALGVLELPSIYAGVNLPLVLILAILFLIPLAYNTACLASALPRAGGDYVFGSRIVHPIWGMIPSFMVLFSFVVGIGTLVVVDLQAFLGPAILTSYPQYATTVLSWVYQSGNVAVLATIILALVFALAIASTKGWFWFIRLVSIYSVVMIFVFFAYLAVTSHTAIITNFNNQNATGFSFDQIMTNATSAGWTPNISASALTVAGAMIFIFFFLAAPISAYFASEIKNTARSMTIGMIGGTIISWVIAAVGVLAFIGVFTYAFISDFSYFGVINPSTASSGLFTVNALVLAVVKDPNVTFLIGLAFAVATLGLVAAPMLPASRILFAWSFDRMIPHQFASVSDRTRTPAVSLAIVGILTIIVAIIDSYYSAAVGGFLATTIIVSIAFFPNGVTAALLPFRRKDIYNLSPPIVTKKVGGFPLLTISGVIHAVGFLVLIVLVFLNPIAAGTNNGIISTGALAIILVGLLVSIIFYPIAKAIRKSSGIDLSLVFSEIPPE
jgi:basic amino acid/polyamine antiporter, APA family